jgi:hypothetical protein
MEPVPYRIRAEDVDEVLTAYEASDDVRVEARAYVLRQLVEIDDVVRTAPETPDAPRRGERGDPARSSDTLSDFSPDRRELALASIEDELLRAGFVELDPGEARLFPTTTRPDSERDDG